MTEATFGNIPKSDAFENFLDRMNAGMHSAFGTPGPQQDAYASAQIVGLPRSGTTILYQLMARSRCVGYPSNLMALFWRTPTAGAQIQVQLSKPTPTISTTSFAGRTREPMDPHEFGYFWRTALGHTANTLDSQENSVDWSALQNWLDAISLVFESPVVYKNFLALEHAGAMRAHLDQAKFILIERSLVDVAASLLTLRRHLEVDLETWVGPRATSNDHRQYKSDIELVAKQVADLQVRKNSCNFSSDQDSVVINYDSLCAGPRSIVPEILDFLGADTTHYRPDRIPDNLEIGAGAVEIDPVELRSLAAAIDNELSNPDLNY